MNYFSCTGSPLTGPWEPVHCPVLHAVRGKEPIAEDAEEPRIAEEKVLFVLGDPRLLGALGDRLFAPNRMNDQVGTAFRHLTQAQVIVRVGRGLP
jgi:hypothetical protein